MDVTQQLTQAARVEWAEEIERAVDNVKRTEWDNWMRREWHKADSRRQWPASRKARWADWRAQRSRGVAGDEAGQPEHVLVTRPKVWVRGRVPREFLDWVENREGSDPAERELLAECSLEEWER